MKVDPRLRQAFQTILANEGEHKVAYLAIDTAPIELDGDDVGRFGMALAIVDSQAVIEEEGVDAPTGDDLMMDRAHYLTTGFALALEFLRAEGRL